MILVAFHSVPLPYQISNLTNQGAFQHPQFGAGRKFRTMKVNLHLTVGELANKVSGKLFCLFVVVNLEESPGSFRDIMI